MVERLSRGPASVSELAAPFAMSLPPTATIAEVEAAACSEAVAGLLVLHQAAVPGQAAPPIRAYAGLFS